MLVSLRNQQNTLHAQIKAQMLPWKSTKYTICTTKGTNVTMSSQKGIISIIKMAMPVSKLPGSVT